MIDEMAQRSHTWFDDGHPGEAAQKQSNSTSRRTSVPNVIYVGDETSHGGKVLTGSSRISLNGRAAARQTDKVSCPRCGDNAIAEGDSKMLDGDLPLAFHGHKTLCGAILLSSSGATGSI
jgi:uncharacterized Zn-binding protein involved in type VI secretion